MCTPHYNSYILGLNHVIIETSLYIMVAGTDIELPVMIGIALFLFSSVCYNYYYFSKILVAIFMDKFSLRLGRENNNASLTFLK